MKGSIDDAALRALESNPVWPQSVSLVCPLCVAVGRASHWRGWQRAGVSSPATARAIKRATPDFSLFFPPHTTPLTWGVSVYVLRRTVSPCARD